LAVSIVGPSKVNMQRQLGS